MAATSVAPRHVYRVVLGEEERNRVLTEMGKELTCPVCLRLLDAPFKTLCNHYFCKRVVARRGQ